MKRASQRFRTMMLEFARFAVVGAIGLLVTGGVFNLLLSWHQAALAANAAGTVAAAVVTFVGSRYWTFRHREHTGLGRETTAFIALNLIGILIQQACLELARHELGAGQNGVTLTAALLLGVGLATLFRFWSYRRFVWLARRRRSLERGTWHGPSEIGTGPACGRRAA